MAEESADVVFITGGSSGIGAGLARAFHARGAKVIISGRNAQSLSEVAKSCPGMETLVLDVAKPTAVKQCAAHVASHFPKLSTVINNAGVQKIVSFAGSEPVPADLLEAEIDTNLKGLIHVTNEFLPLLKRQTQARLIQVSSGLAFVPLAMAPIYSATKAAVHAFTVALRNQLNGSSVKVIELIPPAVITNLHRGLDRLPPRAMGLEEFVSKSMVAIDSGREELAIGLAEVLRTGARISPSFFFKMVNKGS